ncbi:MAG: YebC/PmpR family DNA-binding transcriptional regulator [Planctomycetota bacterium]
MAGHSHSANIRFRKDRVDAQRARLFSKLSRMITVAARQGGNPDANPRLRLALDKARVVSMSKDAIERAIKKGTGEAGGGDFEEIVYEGYGASGVAVLLEILTDNRNRTAPEIRKIFDDHGGKLGSTGSVARMFERRGVFHVDPSSGFDEDRLTEIALEAGADDLVPEGDGFAIHCAPVEFQAVQASLEKIGLPLRDAGLEHVPTITAPVSDAAAARRVVRLIEALDEHDDVQSVHSNEEFSDEVLAELEKDP